MPQAVVSRPQPSRRTAQAGFTLVELMVVLVVIGIVSAIAVPNFVLALHKARRAAAYQSVREIEVAIQHYMVDFNAPPPSLDPDTLQELVDSKALTSGQAADILDTLDGDHIFWYFAWSGWRGSDYWYGIAFRPKGDDPDAWCYLFPDGLWRLDPVDGWAQVE